MSQSDAALTRDRADAKTVVADLAALCGFSVAVAVTAGVVKTPMALPGHSALFWLPVLVLAGAHRRPGMAIGAGLCGGLLGGLWGGIDAQGLAALLAGSGVIEAFGLGRSAQARGVRMIVAGLLAHLGKLGVKLAAGLAVGLPLNAARLPILPTLALYAAFGLAAGAMAWGVLAAWLRLRGPKDEE
jgi:hypothetical protein